jgi:leucyl aminopeptidase
MTDPASLLIARSDRPIPIRLVTTADWEAERARLAPSRRAFAAAHGFEGQTGRHLLLPEAQGALGLVLLGLGGDAAARRDPFAAGRLSALLPAGDYVLRGRLAAPALAALSWCLSAYRFQRYKPGPPVEARLVAPRGVDADEVRAIAAAIAASRDLINTPANDCGPSEIEAAVRALAAEHGATVGVVTGDDLLRQNFPMIHAVGRASPRAPRLINLAWGHPDAPKVTLVGKGVAFDTGGLNLKPDSAMLLMKKDMGGAAAAIAAARLVMASKLPVRLRLLIPAVENAVSGESFRPGDVLQSRKGLTVEIGNTDAEGRLILADALALADEEAPELIVDFATLTGAARVALGPDLPPFFTTDEALAGTLQTLSLAVHDPVWRLPLWPAYDGLLDSKIATVNHISSGGFAGAITAALFLRRFVEAAKAYVHFDVYAWNPSTKPGRPEGGEVQAARLIHAYLKQRYPAS